MKKYFPQIDEKWTLENIGIKFRYFARDFESDKMIMSNSEMTCEAANEAIKNANIEPKDIDLIVTVTASPDYCVPNMACQVQDKLEAKNASAIGLTSGCAGFIVALTTAMQFIENSSCSIALVTGSDLPSAYVDFSHPKYTESQWINATIFGDGAGAVVLQKTENEEGILHSYIGSDGKNNGPFIIHEGGSFIRPSEKVLNEGLHFVTLKLRDIIYHSPKYMIKSIDEVFFRSGLSYKDIDWLIPHQATLPLVRRLLKKIDFPFEKTIITVDNIGNTSDALIPISLDMANKEKKFKKDDKLLLAAAGAGWMYGASIIKWATN